MLMPTHSLRLSFILSILLLFAVPSQAPAPVSQAAELPLAPSSSPSVPALGGCDIFPANNIWNTPIDTLPVHANSNLWVNTITNEMGNPGLFADFGSGVWPPGSDQPIGIPYNLVPGSQALVPVEFLYDDESDPHPVTGQWEYPIPEGAEREGGPTTTSGDRHVLVIDQDNCLLYETYATEDQTGDWTGPLTKVYGGSGAVFDLNDNALRPAGWTSADAAGLPILPGLVRWEEVNAGEITHPIRFTLPQTKDEYVWPARHAASSLTDNKYVPMGQRFRLKASFDTSGFSPEIQVILQAMKTYGIILADNGSAMYISGAPNPNWDNDMLKELGDVKASDFEAVDVSSLISDPDSGAIATFPPTFEASVDQSPIFDSGHARLTFNIDNLNTNPVTGLAFGFNLPAGLQVDSPNGLTNSCNGSASAVAGGTAVSLSGGEVAAQSSCAVALNISGSTGSYTIDTGPLDGLIGADPVQSPAVQVPFQVVAVQPVGFAKTFSPNTVPISGASTLTLSIDNTANPVALAGVDVLDNFPAGLLVATPPGLLNSCGGTVTAVAGSGQLTLVDGSVPASGSCQLAVQVQGTALGDQANTTGTLSTENAGDWGTASDTLTVTAAPAAPTILSLSATCEAITLRYLARSSDPGLQHYAVQVVQSPEGTPVSSHLIPALAEGEVYTEQLDLGRVFPAGTAFQLQIGTASGLLSTPAAICK